MEGRRTSGRGERVSQPPFRVSKLRQFRSPTLPVSVVVADSVFSGLGSILSNTKGYGL